MKLYLTDEKKELFIKTTLWNVIVDIFKEKKEIDISSFLISIKISWKKIFIKTNKPILNAEIILFSDEIKEKVRKKLEKQEIIFDFELKYL